MKTYICVCIGSAFLAFIVTPLVIRLAKALRIVDAPNARKVHKLLIPRLGGLAIAVAMLSMIILVLVLDNRIGMAFRATHTRVTALLVAATIMLIIGLIDDVRGLPGRIKFLAQIVVALGVCAAGIRIDRIEIGSWYAINLGWMAWPMTVFWIVGITNAVNLIDGLDGLAAGICAITCGTIIAFAVFFGDVIMAVLMLALLGSLLGFLYFNFNPAKTFMGDGGTYFVGFLLAGASVLCTAKTSTVVGLALPALAMGIPILDTLFSIFRRTLERRSLFAPDRRHIHHQLLDRGLRHHHAVLVLYVVTAAAAATGLLMLVARDAGLVAVFVGVLAMMVTVFVVAGSIRFGHVLGILRRNISNSRQARKERRDFEEAELQMREATSMDSWWRAVCYAAEKMSFINVSGAFATREGKSRVLAWNNSILQPNADDIARLILPVQDRRHGLILHIKVGICMKSSVESVGRRIAYFGRLLEEYSLATVLSPEQSGLMKTPDRNWRNTAVSSTRLAAG